MLKMREHHDQIKTTLHCFVHGEPKSLPNFGHSVAGHIHTSMKTAAKEASTYLKQRGSEEH